MSWLKHGIISQFRMVLLTENRHKIGMENISQFFFTSIITYNFIQYLQYTATEAMQMGSEECD